MVNKMESVVESDVKRELEDKRRSLNELIETVDNFKNYGESDDAVENCLTRFLMLRACGYVSDGQFVFTWKEKLESGFVNWLTTLDLQGDLIQSVRR